MGNLDFMKFVLPPNEQTRLQRVGNLLMHKVGSARTVVLDQSGQDK